MARDEAGSALPGRVTRAVPATAERICAALTDPATVRRWWGELSPDLQVGQLSQLVLDNGDRYAVEVFRMQPPRLLEYGLRYFAIDVKEAVRWRIAPQDAGCLVTVEFVAPDRGDERRIVEHEEWRERTERLESCIAGRPVPPAAPDRELVLSTDLPGDVASVRAHLARFLDGVLAAGLTVRDGAEPDGFDVVADGDVSTTTATFTLSHPMWRRPAHPLSGSVPNLQRHRQMLGVSRSASSVSRERRPCGAGR